MNITQIDGLRTLAPHYDGYIIDIWGVVHGGGDVYPEVVECLEQLRRADKHAIFLSNAPRRAARVIEALIDKGIPAALCRDVLSSGEATRLSLEARTEDAFANLGRRYITIGPPTDDDLLDGLDYHLTDDVMDAEFMLCIGLNQGTTTVEEHDAVLKAAAARKLPMICVNPDRVVVRLGRREFCAGVLADHYEALGGVVHHVGKPYRYVYDLCFERLAAGARNRVLTIGDGPETDIRGANNAGLDALLVTGGLVADSLNLERTHAAPADDLSAICADANVHPVAAVPTFRW